MIQAITNPTELHLNFENADLLLGSIVSRLISDDSIVGAIVISQIPFRNMATSLGYLLHYKYEQKVHLLEGVDNLIEELYALDELNNRISAATATETIPTSAGFSAWSPLGDDLDKEINDCNDRFKRAIAAMERLHRDIFHIDAPRF